jgi:hypothetical protein
MKQIIYILLIGFCSCNDSSNKTKRQEIPDTIHIQVQSPKIIDTLENLPDKVIKKEYYKSAFAYSYNALISNEFPFNNWLTEIDHKDSLNIINRYTDSAQGGFQKEKYTFNLTDEWQLKYLLKRGWYERGLDRTTINKCYLCKKNKFKLRGADLMKIFKPSERWAANLIAPNKLIIINGHSYPNGNQTSWEYEIIYIFTK